MSPSWDSLQHLPSDPVLAGQTYNVETEPRCSPPPRGTLQISSVDSACLADRSFGFPAAATAKRHIPVNLSPPPWIPWILILVAAIQGHPGRRFFFSHPLELFGLKHLSTSAVLLSGAILLSLVFLSLSVDAFFGHFPKGPEDFAVTECASSRRTNLEVPAGRGRERAAESEREGCERGRSHVRLCLPAVCSHAERAMAFFTQVWTESQTDPAGKERRAADCETKPDLQ